MQITYEQIVGLHPCYHPSEIAMPEDYHANIADFIKEYRHKVKDLADIAWVLLRPEFMTDKELRLFAVWCARQVQHLMTDPHSINALDIAERYANGNATKDELNQVGIVAALAAAADTAAADAAWNAAYAYAAAADTAAHAAYADADARNAQIDRLIEIFEGK